MNQDDTFRVLKRTDYASLMKIIEEYHIENPPTPQMTTFPIMDIIEKHGWTTEEFHQELRSRLGDKK